MGQTKAQEARRGRPSRAGKRSAHIQAYWSWKYPKNMAKRAWRVYKRHLGYGMDHVRAEALAKSCASAHGVGAEAELQRMIKAYREGLEVSNVAAG